MLDEWDVQPSKNNDARIRLLCILCAVFLVLTTVLWIFIQSRTETTSAIRFHTSPLQISEYMSSNSTAYPDENGEFYDWVELYNSSSLPLSLTNYALSDGNGTWLLPNKQLGAGEYLVVFCDGKGKSAGHAGFRLRSAGGEELTLKNPNGAVVDSVRTIALETNTSAIRGENTFTATKTYTPGYANTEEGFAAFQASRLALQGSLLLSEVMPDNTITLPDGDEQFHDYIEVYNASDQPVELTRYGLTNDPQEPLKWQFPERVLQPGEVVLVFASGKGHSADENELHAGFKINKAQDTIYLSSPAGVMIDTVEINGVENDTALIRAPDGSWSRTVRPSPGYVNTAEGEQQFAAQMDKRFGTGLQICEVMTRNTKYVPIGGEYTDWIELYNPTGAAISLKGYCLTNDLTQPSLFALPERELAAGETLLVYATGGTINSKGQPIQANFKLNGGDGMVALIAPDGRVADGMSLNQLPMNTSKGRAEGQPGFVYFSEPTPGKPNGAGARSLTAAPVAATAPGIYNGVQKLEVALSGTGNIYYTTDGSTPTAASARYTAPLSLDKTTVVRAVAVAADGVPSDILTASYIINENHTVDVVSVATDPDNLWSDEKGIYVAGPNASSQFPYKGANYWQYGREWEREANIELFSEGEEGFSLGCGIRMFGAYTRTYDKKSLSVRFRDCYGASALQYPVFQNRDFTRYESLVLRTGGQDWARAMMKDDLTTGLLDEDGVVDTQASRPVILYLNGEYFGVHYIREKINADFVSTHYNVNPDSVDLLQANSTVNHGSNEDYRALMDYLRSKNYNLSDERAYAYVIEQIDEVNFIDYSIAQMYCGNTDLGNIRFFRSSEYDNQWRWILYDTDLGFQGGRLTSVWDYINPDGMGANHAISTALIRSLLTNDRFRQLFAERLEHAMKTTWSTERVLARIDAYYQLWKPEAARNAARWEHSTDWETNVEGLRYFARRRQRVLKEEFASPRVSAVFRLTQEQLDRCFGGL